MSQEPNPPQGQPQRPVAPNVAPAGDVVLYEGVRKQSASWWNYTKWILVMAGASTLGAFAQRIEFFSNWPLYLAGLIGIPGIIYAYLQHITTKYKITTRRVEFERGVVSKSVDSLELWRVLDVRYKQGVVDRILSNATITLIGTDQSDPEFNIHGLPNHRRIFEQLRDAVQAARTRGRPMEFVGHGDGNLEEVGMFQ